MHVESPALNMTSPLPGAPPPQLHRTSVVVGSRHLLVPLIQPSTPRSLFSHYTCERLTQSEGHEMVGVPSSITWSSTVPFQITCPPPSFQTCWILQPTMLRRGWDRTLVVGPKLLLCFLPGHERTVWLRTRFIGETEGRCITCYSLMGILFFHHVCRDPCMFWGGKHH